MNELTNLIQTFPKIGGTAIAILSGTIGWFLRNLFQIIIDQYRYNKELKTFFWKEKINASKKAAEFYFEFLNLINLIIIQFELYESEKIEHQILIENIQNQVAFYQEKMKFFPHFEHHHINMFYDFDANRTIEITNKIFKINQQIAETRFDDANQNIDIEIEKIKRCFGEIKENYIELYEIYQKHVKDVRSDLKKYL